MKAQSDDGLAREELPNPRELGTDGTGTVEPQAVRARGGLPRATRATTTRWLVGRLVKVSVEAGCGFIRAPSGELIYFALRDVVGDGRVRPGERVRYVTDGVGIPRAKKIARC